MYDESLNDPRSLRPGFALPVAILAMVVIGALVTGGFYAATQEGKIGASTRSMTDAQYIAEQGAVNVAGTWIRPDFEATAIYGTSAAHVDSVYVDGQPVGEYSVLIHRLSQRIYLIDSTGRVIRNGTTTGATRRVGMIVRSLNMDIPADRALQIYGGMNVTGSSLVDGNDTYPGNWDNCTNVGGEAGIVAKDATQVSTSGQGEIYGNPPVEEDATLDDSDFLQYGDVDFDYLASLATKVYASGETVTNPAPALTGSGLCNTALKSNWGAPNDETHECHTYFPLIYGEGNLTVNSSTSGQGILLVEGNLVLKGGFEFYGVMLVKGTLITEGTGAHIHGMIMAWGGGDLYSDNQSAGSSIVNFSSCSIERALMYNDAVSRAVPIAERSWVDLSGIGAG